MSSISRLTQDYTRAILVEADLTPDPLTLFGQWLNAAIRAEVPEPSAMTLATATPQGQPSARIVLLKDYDPKGFTFYTNYQSQKGRELEANSQAALLFFWPTLERQVRITGTVSRVSREESERYFHSRPIGSQIGAWASPQSQVLEGRSQLDLRYRELEIEYRTKEVPLPPYWGGFRVYHSAIEFWQGGRDRLHDRFLYSRKAQDDWQSVRLAP